MSGVKGPNPFELLYFPSFDDQTSLSPEQKQQLELRYNSDLPELQRYLIRQLCISSSMLLQRVLSFGPENTPSPDRRVQIRGS